jgi:hypothetical protein
MTVTATITETVIVPAVTETTVAAAVTSVPVAAAISGTTVTASVGSTPVSVAVTNSSIAAAVTSTPITVSVSALDPNSHIALTIGTPANGLSIVGQVLSLALASASVAGALSSANWSTFNGKQDALTEQANDIAIDTLLSNLGLRASGGESFFDTRLMLPMGEISYFSMTGTTVVITAESDGSTNMVKAAPVTSLDNDKEFDNGGANNGRLRYTGTTTRTFHVACTISIAPASANDTFVFGVAKTGTVLASSRVLVQATTASGIRSTAMHVMTSLATNDYLELFVGNTNDADDCTVHSLNIFAMGM